MLVNHIDVEVIAVAIYTNLPQYVDKAGRHSSALSYAKTEEAILWMD